MDIVRNVLPTSIVRFPETGRITVGSAYKSDIFYSFENRILPEHMKIVCTDGNFAELCTPAGLSINYKEGKEKKPREIKKGIYRVMLEYGDELRLYGLWLKLLGEFLLINSYYGEMRVALTGFKGNGRKEIAAY